MQLVQSKIIGTINWITYVPVMEYCVPELLCTSFNPLAYQYTNFCTINVTLYPVKFI